ncbi:MAG: hypothetical protein J6D13_07435, partial [Clostridium sp.]|nr:hypothetical protein [Clostridium sp.]
RYDPEGYCQKMPKSVMQSNWCYRPVLREPDGSLTEPYYDVYFQLEKYGFDQIPTSSTVGRWCNPLEVMLLLKGEIAPERLKGFITVPWNRITMASRYFSVNEASRFYYARKKVYPEWD